MNPLDPNSWGEWLNDRLSEFATSIVNAIAGMLLDPPNLLNSTWAAVVFGNAKGVAPLLANLAIVIAAFLLVVRQRKAAKLLPTLLLALVVVAGLPAFYWLASQIYNAGTILTEAAQFGEDFGAQGSQQVLPVATNIILGFFGFFSIALAGLAVYYVLVVYSILNVTVLFWIPIVMAFYFLFEGARKAMKVLLAILIVSMLTGRPVLMFFLSLGKTFTGLINAEDQLMQFAAAIIGLVLGFIFQFVLVWLAYTGVSFVENKVRGGMNESLIRGKVKTEQDSVMKAALASAAAIHFNGMKGSPKMQDSQGGRSTSSSTTLKQTAVAGASELVAAGAAHFGVPYPAARAATGAASRRINNGIQRRADVKAAGASGPSASPLPPPPSGQRSTPPTRSSGSRKPGSGFDVTKIVTHGSEVNDRDRRQ